MMGQLVGEVTRENGVNRHGLNHFVKKGFRAELRRAPTFCGAGGLIEYSGGVVYQEIAQGESERDAQ